MSIEQKKFLGASITSFNATVGWNGQESKLEVNLVEDARQNDAFLPPEPGTPVYYEYYDFKFGGLLETITMNGSSGGNPLYQAIIVDPRAILNGVQIVLGEYAQNVLGVPNMLNPYGYLEAIQFGNSGANSSGMRWGLIVDALNVLLQSPGDYGGPIQYKGFNFGVTFPVLPAIPVDFRISGTVTFMEFISQICEAGGCDFFVTMDQNANIIINTVSKINVPDLGTIPRFIADTENAVSKNVGQSMVNEPCGKFLSGGKKRDVYFQTANAGQSGPNSNIWWFWGFDIDGLPIIGTGDNDDHVFSIDTRTVNIPGLGNSYTTTIGEMRAVIAGQTSWEMYLAMHDNLDFVFNKDGDQRAVAFSGISTAVYPHNNVRNPHKGKATRFHINESINPQIIAQFSNTNLTSLGNFWMGNAQNLIPPNVQTNGDLLYQFLSSIAGQYYGKTCMVSLPTVRAYRDDLDTVITSVIPTNGGYLEESVMNDAVANNYLPFAVERITNMEDGTIKPFVRFANIATLDFSDISQDQLLFSADRNYIFVEASIISDIFFSDNSTYANPRVAIQLPGFVRKVLGNTNYDSIIAEFFLSLIHVNAPGVDADAAVDSIFSHMDGSFMMDEQYPEAVLPTLVGVPLESQVSRYGPWTAIGKIGAMEFEVDDTLTPWNYGSYSNMNLAAEAKVTTNIANLQLIETGAVEYPGIPTGSLGDQLLATGPYITNIQVSIGSDGVRTAYRMETWKSKFGVLNKTYADRIQKYGKHFADQRRNFKDLLKRIK